MTKRSLQVIDRVLFEVEIKLVRRFTDKRKLAGSECVLFTKHAGELLK